MKATRFECPPLRIETPDGQSLGIGPHYQLEAERHFGTDPA